MGSLQTVFGGGAGSGNTLASGQGLTDFCNSLPDATRAAYPGCGGVSQGPGPVNFTDELAMEVQGPGIGFQPGQCPMLPNGACAAPVGNGVFDQAGVFAPVSCTEYVPCDAYTGAQHPGFVTGALGNPNTWALSQDGQTWVWYGPDGKPATPPNWATPPSTQPAVSTVGEFNTSVQSKLAALSLPGMTYNPSSGWTPSAGSAPTDTSPSIPAFVNSPGNASGGPSRAPGGIGGAGGAVSVTSSGGSPTASGTVKPGAPGSAVAAASLAPGSPNTSGVVSPVVTKPKSNGWLLIGAVVVFVLLAMKG